MKVMRDGRPVTVEVSADAAGLVPHAGTALIAQVADNVRLTAALSLRLAGLKQRHRGHDPGRVIRDLAVMLADGGECVSAKASIAEVDVGHECVLSLADRGSRPRLNRTGESLSCADEEGVSTTIDPSCEGLNARAEELLHALHDESFEPVVAEILVRVAHLAMIARPQAAPS